jgi:mannose-1-phosphate guanylyltransferase
LSAAKKTSLEKEIFPKIAEGGRFFGYPFEGFWFDIGKSEDYIKANIAFLNNGESSIQTSSYG